MPPSLSRRWSDGSGWGRSRLPGKPSFRAPTTQRGLTSTTRCRYPAGAGYWKEVEAFRPGGCLPHSWCVLPPQDEALAPEFLAAAEYSTSPGADLEGLLQRLETVSGEVLAPSPSRTRTREWKTGVPPPCLPPKSKPAGARRAGGTICQEQGICIHLFTCPAHTHSTRVRCEPAGALK